MTESGIDDDLIGGQNCAIESNHWSIHMTSCVRTNGASVHADTPVRGGHLPGGAPVPDRTTPNRSDGVVTFGNCTRTDNGRSLLTSQI